MSKRINKAQLTRKYWPAWRAAEKVLIASGGYDKAEAEAFRKEITGGSSKELTNRQLDECLRQFHAISQPQDGRAQAELADQPLKRVRFVIGQIQGRLGLPDAYVEALAVKLARCPLTFCTEAQLKAVLKALKIHENRRTKAAEG